MFKLSSTHLKVIAIIAMTVNHVGTIFQDRFHPQWWEFTYQVIGKLTFPIMAYMLVLGYNRTRNKLKYFLRLFVTGVLSIIPFHIAFIEPLGRPLYIFNNIMFTLSIGMIMLYFMHKYPNYKWIIGVISCALTSGSDWGMIGVLLIWLLYEMTSQALALTSFSLVMTFLEFSSTQHWMQLNMLGILLVVPLLKFYDPTIRPQTSSTLSTKVSKLFFYAYYPVHLLALYGIHTLI